MGPDATGEAPAVSVGILMHYRRRDPKLRRSCLTIGKSGIAWHTGIGLVH
jgi:hypothetical protein